MIEMGLTEVSLDNNCYLMATLPSNINKEVPTIGFIAHFDTSPDMSGENVNHVSKTTTEKILCLTKIKTLFLRPTIFPNC